MGTGNETYPTEPRLEWAILAGEPPNCVLFGSFGVGGGSGDHSRHGSRGHRCSGTHVPEDKRHVSLLVHTHTHHTLHTHTTQPSQHCCRKIGGSSHTVRARLHQTRLPAAQSEG